MGLIHNVGVIVGIDFGVVNNIGVVESIDNVLGLDHKISSVVSPDDSGDIDDLARFIALFNRGSEPDNVSL